MLGAMAEGVGNTPGQQTVDFSLLVKRTAEDAFSSLRELAGIAQEQSDSERKLSLLKNFLRTRQRLLRVLSLSKWCRQVSSSPFHRVLFFHSSLCM